DDAAFGLLAERKRLLEAQRAYAARQRAEAERLAVEAQKREAMQALQKRRAAMIGSLNELNQSISPDKDDEALLVLIARRQALERELADLAAENGQPEPAAVAEDPRTMPGDAIVEETPVAQPQDVQTAKAPVSPVPEIGLSPVEAFGREAISQDDFNEGSAFHRYLEQLKSNMGSLGTLLQEMPLDAKKNKAFMLRVAGIDPAYAMHYAADTLKKDEDFNIRIASLKNPRNSGNAIAEMLPEARTSKVILAAVKQDYRNVRFVRPDMEEYDEILRIAKQAALEKLAHLREAADIELLIPKLLRQDAQFMQAAGAIAASSEKEKAAA
ncbi:MAG: hypothetical protein WAW00_03385, partial [Candidatus Moraniibacteriota bacterium]